MKSIGNQQQIQTFHRSRLAASTISSEQLLKTHINSPNKKPINSHPNPKIYRWSSQKSKWQRSTTPIFCGFHMWFSELNGRPGCSAISLLEKALRRSPEHSSAAELTPFQLLGPADGRPHKWLPGEKSSCLTWWPWWPLTRCGLRKQASSSLSSAFGSPPLLFSLTGG